MLDDSEDEVFFGPVSEKENKKIVLLKGRKTEIFIPPEGYPNIYFPKTIPVSEAFPDVSSSIDTSEDIFPISKEEIPEEPQASDTCLGDSLLDLTADSLNSSYRYIQGIESFEDSLEDVHCQKLSLEDELKNQLQVSVPKKSIRVEPSNDSDITSEFSCASIIPKHDCGNNGGVYYTNDVGGEHICNSPVVSHHECEEISNVPHIEDVKSEYVCNSQLVPLPRGEDDQNVSLTEVGSSEYIRNSLVVSSHSCEEISNAPHTEGVSSKHISDFSVVADQDFEEISNATHVGVILGNICNSPIISPLRYEDKSISQRGVISEYICNSPVVFQLNCERIGSVQNVNSEHACNLPVASGTSSISQTEGASSEYICNSSVLSHDHREEIASVLHTEGVSSKDISSVPRIEGVNNGPISESSVASHQDFEEISNVPHVKGVCSEHISDSPVASNDAREETASLLRAEVVSSEEIASVPHIEGVSSEHISNLPVASCQHFEDISIVTQEGVIGGLISDSPIISPLKCEAKNVSQTGVISEYFCNSSVSYRQGCEGIESTQGTSIQHVCNSPATSPLKCEVTPQINITPEHISNFPAVLQRSCEQTRMMCGRPLRDKVCNAPEKLQKIFPVPINRIQAQPEQKPSIHLDVKNSLQKENSRCKENIPVSFVSKKFSTPVNKNLGEKKPGDNLHVNAMKPPNILPKGGFNTTTTTKIPVSCSKPRVLVSPKIHFSGRQKLMTQSEPPKSKASSCLKISPCPYPKNIGQKPTFRKPLFVTPTSKGHCKVVSKQKLDIVSPVSKYIRDHPPPPLVQTVKPKNATSALIKAAMKPAMFPQKVWKNSESNHPVLPAARYCAHSSEKVEKSPFRKIATARVAMRTPPTVIRHIGSSKVIPGCNYLASEESFVALTPNAVNQRRHEKQQACDMEMSVMEQASIVRTNTIAASHLKYFKH